MPPIPPDRRAWLSASQSHSAMLSCDLRIVRTRSTPPPEIASIADCRELRRRAISSKPSISGMPRSIDQDVGLHRGNAVECGHGDDSVVTFAPADSNTTRSRAQRIVFIVDGEDVDRRTGRPDLQRRRTLGPGMLAPRLQRVRAARSSAAADAKGGPLPLAGAGGLHRAAVHLDDVADDGEAEAKSAGLARGPASAWRKRSKTYGRKSGRMPMPVSLTLISTCELTRVSRSWTGRRSA